MGANMSMYLPLCRLSFKEEKSMQIKEIRLLIYYNVLVNQYSFNGEFHTHLSTVTCGKFHAYW